jgi:hypothetical protein
MSKFKTYILNLSLKKIYNSLFLSDLKKNSYFSHLKELYFEFLSTKFPKIRKDDFENSLNSLISLSANQNKDTTELLYNAFEPNFKDNLNNYYKLFEKNTFFRFLEYSINIKLIKKKYSDVYNFAIEEINEPLDILEIGGGVPHGLIFNNWKREKSFCRSLIYIEADMLHSEFVTWYCKKNSIPLEKQIFPAAEVPTIKNINYNFVFAKDIFEHLDKPEKLIDELIFYTRNPKTLLCLDLEHKGAYTTQHISPNLPVLKKKLIDNNFEVIEKFEEVHVWKKITNN